jgi:hypothetical protein
VLYLWDDVLLLLTGAPRSPQHSGEHSGGGRFPSKRVRAPALGDVLLVLIQILAFSNSYILIFTSRCTGWTQDNDERRLVQVEHVLDGQIDDSEGGMML